MCVQSISNLYHLDIIRLRLDIKGTQGGYIEYIQMAPGVTHITAQTLDLG